MAYMIRSLCPYTIVKTSLENLAERKIEDGFSCRSSGKFPGVTEHVHLKRKSCISGLNVSNGNSFTIC